MVNMLTRLVSGRTSTAAITLRKSSLLPSPLLVAPSTYRSVHHANRSVRDRSLNGVGMQRKVVDKGAKGKNEKKLQWRKNRHHRAHAVDEGMERPGRQGNEKTEASADAAAVHMKIGFTELHVIHVLFQYYRQKQLQKSKSGKSHPALDLFISRYLKQYDMMPKQRMLVVNLVYDMHRWMLLLQYLTERLFNSSRAPIAAVVKEALSEGMFDGVGNFLSREKFILKEAGQTSSRLSSTQLALVIKKMKTQRTRKKNKKNQHSTSVASFDVLNHLKNMSAWSTFADKNNHPELMQWRIRYFIFTELILKNVTMFEQLYPRSAFSLQMEGEQQQHGQQQMTNDFNEAERAVLQFKRELGEQNFAAREMRDAVLHEYGMASDHVKVSMPADLFDLLVSDLGSQNAAKEFSKVSNTVPPIYLRANPLKVKSRKKFLFNIKDSVLAKAESKADTTLSPGEITFSAAREAPWAVKINERTHINVRETELYKLGWFEVQDLASQRVADLVCPRPGDRVLDYCAGSGGKTLAFAHKLRKKGVIYMTDTRYTSTAGNDGVNVKRNMLLEARKRLRHAGIQNCQPLPLGHPELNRIKGTLDWVLLDVPCTGVGTLRRHPELKYRFGMAWLHELIGMQREIIDSGVEYLNTKRESSRLVYSTCSVLKAENQMQVDHILDKYGHLLELEHVFQTTPEHMGKDGFFAAVFKPRSTKSTTTPTTAIAENKHE